MPPDPSDALVARSLPELGLGLGSYINFRHSLEAGPLPPGLYYLDVLEEAPRAGALPGLDALESQARRDLADPPPALLPSVVITYLHHPSPPGCLRRAGVAAAARRQA